MRQALQGRDSFLNFFRSAHETVHAHHQALPENQYGLVFRGLFRSRISYQIQPNCASDDRDQPDPVYENLFFHLDRPPFAIFFYPGPLKLNWKTYEMGPASEVFLIHTKLQYAT